MTLYAAYGSNLDPRQMMERAPHSPHRGNGWLRGWPGDAAAAVHLFREARAVAHGADDAHPARPVIRR